MGFMPDGPPVIDDAPLRARVGVKHALENLVSYVYGPYHQWSEAYADLLRGTRRYPKESAADYDGRVYELLIGCDWQEFYEAVEHVTAGLAKSVASRDQLRSFREHVNRIFAEENVGYTMGTDGTLTMTASPALVEAAASALDRAKGGPYAAAGEQLRRALEKLSFRKLDPTNAAKDAVGALQGVIGVRFGKGSVSDSSAQLRRLVHPTLAGAVEALVKVEAYRGDMAAHADKPDRTVELREAVFVVHLCAAAIALLAE